MAGFEPAAPWPPAKCATKLRHIPVFPVSCYHRRRAPWWRSCRAIDETTYVNIPAVLLGLVIVGLVLGSPIGYRVAQERRATADYRKTKASLPGMRKDMWLLRRRAAGGVVLFVVVFIAFALAVTNGGEGAG
jgi:hypothetical protein